MRLNYTLRTILILLIIINLFSCASFPQNYDDSISLDIKNVTDLNGEYEISAIKDTLNDNKYIEYHNAFEKFYRGYGRGVRDTLKIIDLASYTFKINLVNDENINIKYLKNGKTFKTFRLKSEFKSDGFLYLKNRNFKIGGIPYIFGGIDIKKLRLGIDLNKNLIIEEVFHSSGAMLLVFGDSKTWNYKHHYKKIK